jgi:hypothetical protein
MTERLAARTVGAALLAGLCACSIGAGGLIGCGQADVSSAPDAGSDASSPQALATTTQAGGSTKTELHARALARATGLAALHRPLAEVLAPNPDGLHAETTGGFASLGFRNAHDASLLGARFPTHADQSFQLAPARVERWGARFAPEGAAHVEGVEDEGRLIYPQAWPSTDLIVATGRRGVEWALVLNDARAPSTFAWKVDLGKGLRVGRERHPNGAIDLLDSNGDAALRVLPAFAIDAKGVRREVAVALEDGALRVGLDTRGLAYPILIDPVVEVPIWQRVLKGGDPGGFPYRANAGGAWFNNSFLAIGGRYPSGGWVLGKDAYSYASGGGWTVSSVLPSTYLGGGIRDAGVTTVGSKLYLANGCIDADCTYPFSSVLTLTTAAGWQPLCTGTACNIGSIQAGLTSVGTQVLSFGGASWNSGQYTVWGTLSVLDTKNAATSFAPVTVTSYPSGRRAPVFVGQPNGTYALIFGGAGKTPTELLGDTWLYTKTGDATGKLACLCNCIGTTPQMPPCQDEPFPRAFASAVWDAARQSFIVAGGFAAFGDGFGQTRSTYEFNPVGNKWTRLCGESQLDGCGGINPFDSAAAAWDPNTRRTMITGGTVPSGGASQPSGDTYTLYLRGGTCSADADCDTGHCVENTCCETASCGTCQTCAGTVKPGQCDNIALGQPDTVHACAACDGAGSCKKALGQTCTTGSECAYGNCVDGTCCQTTSCGGGLTCANSYGYCLKVLGSPCNKDGDCGSGHCADGVCCGVANCGAGMRCDFTASAGSCKKVTGQACTAASDCGTGYCVDGWCCGTACSGQCEACDVVHGLCQPITGAPHNGRAACAGSAPCGSFCNGSDPTACHYAGSAIACGTPSCASGVEQDVSTCDGSGACKPNSKACGAFTCGGTSCNTTCTTSAQCSSGYYCKSGTCSPKEIDGTNCTVGGASSCASGNCVDGVCCKSSACTAGGMCNVTGAVGTCSKPAGVACSDASECGSGFCVDKVCCDKACNGQCEACDVSGKVGTCSAVSGAPHGSRTACGGTGVGGECAKVCDGSDTTTCKYPGGAKSCGAATCVTGVETHVAVCDGAGGCKDVPATCNGYVCGASACKTTCSTSTDCASGYYCKPGTTTCVPIEGLGTSCSTSATCTSGFCTDGVCCAVSSCGGADRACNLNGKGTCVSKNGAACTANAECASNHCVDGYCCDGACTGTCEACNQAGNLGKCVPVVGNPLAGHGACTDPSTDASCASRCDGTTGTKCAYAPTTTACGTPTCGGGVERPVSTCNGAGACNVSPKSCGSYQCGSTSCLTSCVDSSDCLAGSFCKTGACVPTLALGERCDLASDCKSGFCALGVCCEVASCGSGSACAAAPSAQAGKCLKQNGVTCAGPTECASGHCVDGVCCDAACNGQCEGCKVTGSEGTCTAVFGDPLGTRDACDALDAKDCAKRQCDGTVRDKCNGYRNGATQSCGADACLADKRLQRAGSCDGKGGCHYPDPTSCSPYACDATATNGCKSSCATEADCGDGFVCTKGSCVQGATCSDDGLSSVDKTGVAVSCAPYRCGTDGLCLSRCDTSDSCTPGTTCDTDKHACIVVQQTTTDSGGCTTTTNSSGTSRTTACTIGALAALAALTRRRVARRR